MTGEPAHAIVSRALNRRLPVEALCDVSGITVPWPAPIAVPATYLSPLFAQVLDDLRDVVVARSTDSQVLAKAKNAAKVIKYLESWDLLGTQAKAAEHHALGVLLNEPDLKLDAARLGLLAAIRTRQLKFGDALCYFADQAVHDAQLVSGA